jgi:hypothetical protein
LLPLALAVGIGLAGRRFMPAVSTACLVTSVGFMWIIIVVTAVLTTDDLREKIIALI